MREKPAPPPAPWLYGDRFFVYTTGQSLESAKAIVPVLRRLMPDVASVIDFGCAQGAWLRTWQDIGVEDVLGLDGDYVKRATLLIPECAFRSHDLNAVADAGRRFDLAQSLEVAEHLSPEGGAALVESLTAHADRVLFSAAPPGQGGENHINEQPYEYWRDLFRARGYRAHDCVRPLISGMEGVARWYRYNLLLYVKESSEAPIASTVLASRLPENRSIPDISPSLYKVRKAVVRRLPAAAQNWIAWMLSRVRSVS